VQSYPDIPNFKLFVSLKIRSVCGITLIHKGMALGALIIFTYEQERVFSEDDITLMKGLANLAAQALNNASLFGQLSTSREHLHDLSRKLVEVQEAERRALALELHDELGQILNSVKLSLDMIPLLPEAGAQKQFQRASTLVSDLVGRVRRMALELRPSMLDDMGLLPALLWLFRSYQSQTNTAVEFSHTNIEQRFSPQVEITAYRIVQEALTNAIRHAKNKQVSVNVWTDKYSLNLQVVDHGGGFDVKKVNSTNTSSGLSGMRERARLIGGELIVESVPGEGTSLTASLPLAESVSMRG
jgi:signal transduction histidine kinase